MKKLNIFLIVIIFIASLAAQEKTFSLKDVILNGRTKFSPKNLNQLQWMGESNFYTYVDSLNGDFGIIKGTPDNQPDELILRIDSLNAALKTIGAKPSSRFPRFDWTDNHTIRFWNSQKLLAYNIQTKKIILLNEINEGGENADIDDNSSAIAFTKDNNLFIALRPDVIRQITFDTEDGIVNGQTVHRNEFGIRKGIFWSPKGNYVAYYHKDERMVYAYPLVDVDVTPAKLFTTRYPMTGEPSEHVQIGVYNLNTASTTMLQTGEPKDQYLTSVVWSPDEKYIFVGHLNRDQNHLRMIQYDAYTGAPVKTIFEEQHPKYVNPQSGVIFDNQHPDQFLWFSQRDGFNHLYLYSTNGKLIRQLTRGNFDVLSLDAFDSKGDYAFISAVSPDGLDEYGYRVKINSGKMQKITTASGLHNVIPSADGKLCIDSYSSLDLPRKIQLIDSNGKEQKSLLVAENPFEGYQLGKVVLSKIKNDGIELNTRLFYPANFDPSKKYPVMVYVYGGPGVQLIQNRWMGGVRALDLYMSQEGYFVFTLDNRGSTNRGLEFEQATFRHLGTVEVEDQKAGLDYLKSLAFIDTTKMGVFGWSYGGFMTLSMMTRLPGEFKAAVAGAPVTDWKYYEVMYGERYMDTPDANPEGYAESSTLNYIKNLEGDLLVIHGTVDPTVVWQNTLVYIDKAVKLGKQVDYAVYPGHQHGIRGKDSYHLYQKIYNYFDRFLKH